MEIYLVILEDRHIDVEVTPYESRGEALAAAREILDENGGGAGDLNLAMIKDGWIFYGEYGTEGDLVRVVERELR